MGLENYFKALGVSGGELAEEGYKFNESELFHFCDLQFFCEIVEFLIGQFEEIKL